MNNGIDWKDFLWACTAILAILTTIIGLLFRGLKFYITSMFDKLRIELLEDDIQQLKDKRGR